jgi:hypothetical protein
MNEFIQWEHALQTAYSFTNPFRIAAALSLGLRPPCEDEASIIHSMYEKLFAGGADASKMRASEEVSYQH